MARSLVWQILTIYFTLLFSLSLSAPSEAPDVKIGFTKRASPLDALWRSIPGTQKAGGNSALSFNIDHTRSDAWGITFLYGCTALMISDPDHVIVAHMQEESGNGCISLTHAPTVERFIRDKLALATDLWDAGPRTRVDITYNSNQGSGQARLDLFENFLTQDWDLKEPKSIKKWASFGGSGIGDAPGSPSGKAVIQYIAGNGQPTGTLKVFIGSSPNRERPVHELNF